MASHYYHIEGVGVTKGADLNYVAVGMAAAHYNLPLIAVPIQNGVYNMGEAGAALLSLDFRNTGYDVNQTVRGTSAFWQGFGYEYYKRN